MFGEFMQERKIQVRSTGRNVTLRQRGEQTKELVIAFILHCWCFPDENSANYGEGQTETCHSTSVADLNPF